jgi:tetratricopeptide (TPR) repeat protein
MKRAWTILALALAVRPAGAEDAFAVGTRAYLAGDYDRAADQFRAAAQVHPSAGAFHNLGNAEWKRGQTGPAILAWERAHWLDPYAANTRANLRFVRRAAQLEAPALSWFENCSTWLPVNAWALLAGASFWLAVAMLVLPGALRWRKAEWHQALAAACFAVFLLTLPALLGVHSRTRLGVLLARPVPLRLTPTREAQTLGHLPAGEMARQERERGDYVFIRAGNDAAGWVERTQFGLVSGR